MESLLAPPSLSNLPTIPHHSSFRSSYRQHEITNYFSVCSRKQQHEMSCGISQVEFMLEDSIQIQCPVFSSSTRFTLRFPSTHYSSSRLKASNSKCRRGKNQLTSRKFSYSKDSGVLGRVRATVKQTELQEAQEPLPKRNLAQVEWKEFEEAVESKDLGRALKALEVLNRFESDTSDNHVDPNGSSKINGSLGSESLDARSISAEIFFPRAEYLKVLDTCQSALDLQLVGQAYRWLQERGFLSSFGKFKSRVFEASEGGRVVTAADMLASAGLDGTVAAFAAMHDQNSMFCERWWRGYDCALIYFDSRGFKQVDSLYSSSLSPKKWGLAGNSGVQLVVGFSIISFLVNNNIDIRPILVVIVGLGLLDSIYLGGTGQAQALSLWPPHKKRVLVHEAGHVLVAYLLGCPVRGVVLDAMEAIKSGIKGQAGTQFWDESLEQELRQDRLTAASIDRYCIVLFAGIAAEGLVYGEAEGGESDENMYKGVISQLQPPWGPGKMSNQARWAVLQAFCLLKEHRKVHEAVVQGLEQGASLATLINTIETSMAAQA